MLQTLLKSEQVVRWLQTHQRLLQQERHQEGEPPRQHREGDTMTEQPSNSTGNIPAVSVSEDLPPTVPTTGPEKGSSKRKFINLHADLLSEQPGYVASGGPAHSDSGADRDMSTVATEFGPTGVPINQDTARAHTGSDVIDFSAFDLLEPVTEPTMTGPADFLSWGSSGSSLAVPSLPLAADIHSRTAGSSFAQQVAAPMVSRSTLTQGQGHTESRVHSSGAVQTIWSKEASAFSSVSKSGIT